MELRLKKRIVGSLILLAAALIIIPLFFNHSVPSSELQLSDEIPDRPAKPGNLALPIPPKEATVPASARAASKPTGNSDTSQSRIVFEQLQSLGSGSNNNLPVTPVAASQPMPSAAASTMQTAVSNNGNAPQKTAMSPATPATVAANRTTTTPATAAETPSPMNIGKLEQQTTGFAPVQKTTPDESVPDINDEPVASQPTVTHKKSAKTNSPNTTKAQSAAKTQNTAPSPDSWAVQLGSFSDKLNAENLVKKLQAEGFPAYIRTSKTAHGNLIRVLVGPELRHADAKNLLAKLQKQLNLQGMVVKGG